MEEIKLFKSNQHNFLKSVDKLLDNVTELKKTTDSILEHKQLISKLEIENNQLKKEISVIKDRMDRVKRKNHIYFIEVSNLPVNDNENLQEVLGKIHIHFKVPLKDVDVTKIYRKKTTVYNDRPLPVVIKYQSEIVRHKLLLAYKLNGKILNANNVGFSIDSRIYINEFLPSDKKRLLYNVRCVKRENNFKHAWVKNNKTYLRKDDGSKILFIKNQAMLDGIVDKLKK